MQAQNTQTKRKFDLFLVNGPAVQDTITQKNKEIFSGIQSLKQQMQQTYWKQPSQPQNALQHETAASSSIISPKFLRSNLPAE